MDRDQIGINSTRKIAISGVVMALYIVVMYFTQGFAFGQYQIRIATSIYALSAIHPFLIVPLGLSNLLSNMLMGGMGIFDIVGGFFVGIMTSYFVYLIGKHDLNYMLIALPIILIPGLVVPIWLSYIIQVPYIPLAIGLVIGQIIPGIMGAVLFKNLKDKLF